MRLPLLASYTLSSSFGGLFIYFSCIWVDVRSNPSQRALRCQSEQAWRTDGVLKANKGTWLAADGSCVLLHLSAFPQGGSGYRSQQYRGRLCCGSLYSVVLWLKQSISISPKGARGPGPTFLGEKLGAGGNSIHLAIGGAMFMF